MGYKSSYKLIKKNSEIPIEQIIKDLKEIGKYKLEDNYTEKVLKAKIIFYNKIYKQLKELWNDNQISIIKQYLEKYTKFSEQKIKNRIKNIYGYCI